jgi:growth arrest-specific protein 8
MPPKKEKKEKKAKDDGGGRPATGDGGEGDGLSVNDLKAQIKDMKDGLRKEQEERNYYQLERDKINTFWEITKKELDEKKVTLTPRSIILPIASACGRARNTMLRDVCPG